MAGADRLIKLNAKTGPNLSINVRFLHCQVRTVAPKKNPLRSWSCFSAKLIDADGDYCGFEAKAFGTEEDQKKAMHAFKERFADGLAFTLSNIKMVKSANATWDFYSVMQVVDYQVKAKVPTVKLTPILKSSIDDKALPHFIETRLRLSDLQSLQDGRTVDLCAVLKSCIAPTKPSPTSPLWELTLADESGHSIAMTWWPNSPKPSFILSEAVGQPLCFFNVWAARREETQDLKPLSSTERTTCCIICKDAAGERGTTMLTNASSIAESDTPCLTVAANYSSHDYTLGEAIETTVGNLTLLENSRHLSSIDAMFQVRAATVNLSTRVAVKEDLYVKDGSRLFVPIVIHDATGSIECRLAEKPALALSGCESCDAMEAAFEDGSLGFSRGVLRVFLSTSETHESEGYVNLVVVAALPIVAGPWRLPVLMVGKIGTNIVATTLSKLQYTTLGSFQIDMENGKFVLADSVLLLLRGSAAPKTVSRDGALAIENMNVIDAAGDDKTATDIKTSTVAPASALVAYSLARTSLKVCLASAAVPIAGTNDIQELIIANVWSPDHLNVDISTAKALFLAEVNSTREYFLRCRGLKRKADVSDIERSQLFTPSPKNPKFPFSPDGNSPDFKTQATPAAAGA